MKFRSLEVGDAAPWFTQRSASNPAYSFASAAGRYIVLCFVGTASDANGQAMFAILSEHRALFDDSKVAFFAVSIDATDESTQRLKQDLPGIRVFWDFDAKVSKAYGAAPDEVTPGGRVGYRRLWLVLDPTLRIMATFTHRDGAQERHEVARFVDGLPALNMFAGIEVHAPILILPNVFEPAFCDRLIAHYNAQGGQESGFMREIDGKTTLVSDATHKKRSDCIIEDAELIEATRMRVRRRVAPEIRKVHQFIATRMERYLIGCYDAASGGHFRAHRDNTTRGTAHRRFAVSINLNANFDGGEVGFPEYGQRSYKAPPGGAVVFSCSLLHAVSPVTRGQRFAFLPFLYDDEAAKIREQNIAFVEGGSDYKA